MTDLAHDLTHLSAPASRLAAAVARPRRLAILCVAALTALGWGALGLMAADAGIWQAICQPAGVDSALEAALALGMWSAMALAMMLPTAAPMMLTYAEIADTAAAKGEPAASPLYLAAGYCIVWLGFAAVAALLQFAFTRTGLLDAGRASLWLAAAVFTGAGLYQFSRLKHACLTVCQRPFPFFFANWTAEPAGVVRLGVRQGLACLGCCWALMLVMFAAGAMNIVWMALLGIVMTIEKMSKTARFSQAVGILLVAVGLGVVSVIVVK